MKTKVAYWLILGAFVAGLALGVTLVLVFRPAPPGWMPVYDPEAESTEWSTYARYASIDEDKITEWYKSVQDTIFYHTKCDGEPCFVIFGMLNGQILETEVIHDGDGIIVTLKPTEDTSLIDSYYQIRSPEQKDYFLLAFLVICIVGCSLVALGVIRLTKAVPKNHPLNRKLGLIYMLNFTGFALGMTRLDYWFKLSSTEKHFLMFLGWAVMFVCIFLVNGVWRKIHAIKQASEGTQSPNG